jgi:hypothetical protein
MRINLHHQICSRVVAVTPPVPPVFIATQILVVARVEFRYLMVDAAISHI